jgi:hypothetical protein
VDPFDSSSIQITQNVHHLLTYFEKPFLTQIVVAPLPSPRLDSACSQVIRDCVFDETNYSSWSSAESGSDFRGRGSDHSSWLSVKGAAAAMTSLVVDMIVHFELHGSNGQYYL